MVDLTKNVKFLYDANNNKVAAQLDIDVFEAIESYIEDQGLLRAMLENKDEDLLDLEEAKEYYEGMKKEVDSQTQ